MQIVLQLIRWVTTEAKNVYRLVFVSRGTIVMLISWSEFRHALRQRNSLLKSRKDLKLLDYWDEHLLGPSRLTP